MENLAQSLKILADPTRLRILRLLGTEALSVGELTTILGSAQSSVSKQLGALRRAGLVQEEREGTYAFYRLEGNGDPVWPTVAGELNRQEDQDGDLARLAEVVRRRADRGSRSGRLLEPGRSWPAWARALTPAAALAGGRSGLRRRRPDRRDRPLGEFGGGGGSGCGASGCCPPASAPGRPAQGPVSV